MAAAVAMPKARAHKQPLPRHVAHDRAQKSALADIRKAMQVPDNFELVFAENGVMVWSRVVYGWEHLFVAGRARFVSDWIDIMTGDECFWLDDAKLMRGVVVRKGCRKVDADD